jgi:uncharacterized lipoprotein NlpE involved in copper resistance
MKTTWYSICAAAMVGLMLTGCNNNPQKDKIDADKKAKVNAVDNKAEAERDRIKNEADAKVEAVNQKEKEIKDEAKREAEMKKDAIDNNNTTPNP